MKSREEGIAERNIRIVDYVTQGWTAEEIADREGLERDYTQKLRTKLIKEHKIKPPKTSRKNKTAFGITEHSARIRSRLADHLQALKDEHPTPDVAFMIGLTQREQNEAKYGRSKHNWTLGQMERLAVARGISFAQLWQTLEAR